MTEIYSPLNKHEKGLLSQEMDLEKSNYKKSIFELKEEYEMIVQHRLGLEEKLYLLEADRFLKIDYGDSFNFERDFVNFSDRPTFLSVCMTVFKNVYANFVSKSFKAFLLEDCLEMQRKVGNVARLGPLYSERSSALEKIVASFHGRSCSMCQELKASLYFI